MIRVLGLGSPFGDDRAGWWVIERLRGKVPREIDLVTLDRPGAALINWMADARHLVIVDAVVDGGPPGRVLRIPPHQLDDGPGPFTSHQLALSETLRLARALNALPPRVDIYGVTIADADHASHLVETAVDRLSTDLISQLTESSGAPRHGFPESGSPR